VTAYTTTTEQHESVEDLIRYAAHTYAAAMLSFPASRVSKLIRREFRAGGPVSAREAVDGEVSRLAWARAHDRRATADDRSRQAEADRRALYVDAGYADPTGADAARNLDAVNVAEKLRARWAGVRHEFA
jgi:hypothetical protein